MPVARVIRGVIAVALAVACLHARGALAGSMTLTMTGFPEIDVLSFSTGATRNASTTTGAGLTSTLSFHDFNFTMLESAAAPLAYKDLATGVHVSSAVLQVRDPATSVLVSDWSFTGSLVTGLSGGGSGDARSPTTFSVSLNNYSTITYRVYASDGVTVASRMCWNVVTSVAC